MAIGLFTLVPWQVFEATIGREEANRDGRLRKRLSSAGRAVVAVRGLHRFALREGWTTVDAAREVRPPAPARRLPKAISVAQVEALLAVVEATPSE